MICISDSTMMAFDPTIKDNASFTSRSSSTHSTVQHSIKTPPRQLRRVKTMTQITRWVSKRISRSSLVDSISENALSEKNLNDLNMATIQSECDDSSTRDHQRAEKSLPVNAQAKVIETIQEDVEETRPEGDLEQVRELRLRKSYAAFCEEFTLSGSRQARRTFDILMGLKENTETDGLMEGGQSEPTLNDTAKPMYASDICPERSLQDSRMTTQTKEPPIHTAMLPANRKTPDMKAPQQLEMLLPDIVAPRMDTQLSSIPHPRPPPQIMTPSVYKEMQRATRERKRARRQRLWEPVRSFFSKSLPLRGHRCEIES